MRVRFAVVVAAQLLPATFDQSLEASPPRAACLLYTALRDL